MKASGWEGQYSREYHELTQNSFLRTEGYLAFPGELKSAWWHGCFSIPLLPVTSCVRFGYTAMCIPIFLRLQIIFGASICVRPEKHVGIQVIQR